MTIEVEVLDHHIIYGSWDDTYGSQFIVHYHENGRDATVFILGGADYGGGVFMYGDVSSKELDELIDKYEWEYDLYEAVSKLVKEGK